MKGESGLRRMEAAIKAFTALVVAAIGGAAVYIVVLGGSDPDPGVPRPALVPEAEEDRTGPRPPYPIRHPGEPRDKATVQRVKDRYGDSIPDGFPAVAGYGIAAAEEATRPDPSEEAFVILVLVERPGAVRRYQYSLRGVPLEFKYSGTFRIQPTPVD